MSYKPNSVTQQNNTLVIAGLRVKDLAETHGTPLYILDAKTIKDQCLAFTSTLNKLHPNSQVLYAGKANLTVGLAQFIAQQGLGIDVVSGGELFTVLEAGVSPEDIYFHGNNKTADEIVFGVQSGITFVIDNATELDRIIATAKDLGKVSSVLLRVIPNVETDTHKYIQTGQADSKFGVSTDEALVLIQKMDASPELNFHGVHHHIGSQILSSNPYKELSQIAVDFLARIKSELGIEVSTLNLGGGFGISYTNADTEPHPEVFLKPLITGVLEQCSQNGLTPPKLMIEPGRSIVGRAGLTVYKVGTVKQAASKRFIFVDGGMADNPRPMMYHSKHAFELVDAVESAPQCYTIAGKYCESGDILGIDIDLPEPKPDSLLVSYGTGAYNYVMASHYNRACRPAMILVEDTTVLELVKRETYTDLIAFDRPLSS